MIQSFACPLCYSQDTETLFIEGNIRHNDCLRCSHKWDSFGTPVDIFNTHPPTHFAETGEEI